MKYFSDRFFKYLTFTGLALCVVGLAGTAYAFCGFYVAKADADLFNKASKVVMARADNRTVITMANDYSGDLDEFAIVIPVPEVLVEEQIHVTENRIIDHLDAYTAPRLVEYFDSDPCSRMMYEDSGVRMSMAKGSAQIESAAQLDKAFGVTIEAEYTVGEYDIVILSAKQSDGLLNFLNQEGYKLPKGAESILGSYIKQDMKFFLAKVNLEEQAKSGFSYLRPLQVAFESEKFMLPIRLGTLNADGPQDLILYTLTKKGRVEAANYRTTKIPSDENIPLFVKDKFGEFYQDMFETAVEKENMKTVFLEYAWDMGWCDPCAADPLPNEDLRTLGVWWTEETEDQDIIKPVPSRPSAPIAKRIMPRPMPTPVNTFVTRLHVRYTAETFPEDLMLNETADRQNFQGRYVMNHPFTGEASCEAGLEYKQKLPARFDEEAKTLARLTGWDVGEIREEMEKNGQSSTVGETGEGEEPAPKKPWWEQIWGR